MANQPTMNGIKNSWSLTAFAKSHGKAQLATFKPGTPDEFKGLAFTDPNDGHVTFVSFSSKLGELSKDEIKARKNELQVAELNVDAETAARRAEKGAQMESYSLCAVGANAWEDIDLGL